MQALGVRIVGPTFIVSLLLLSLSALVTFSIWSGHAGSSVSQPPHLGFAGAGAIVAAITATIIAPIVAIAAVVLAGRTAHALQRTYTQLQLQVELAARTLGQPLDRAAGPQDKRKSHLVSQLERLLKAIERIVEERQQRERELLRADQLAMVGQIAAGVAHELRNPLTSVKMLVQTSQKAAGLESRLREDLQIIEQEIRRMEKSLQRFLDFARPPQPERRRVNLSEVIGRALALVEGRAAKQNVTLSWRSGAGPLFAEADADQLQQLLLNLILNALDVMPAGGALEIVLDDSAADWLAIDVADTGPGIPPELLPRLFDPFISTKETGIGLGLAVSHRIAASHGGSLSAVNRPQGGACFHLELPRPGRAAGIQE